MSRRLKIAALALLGLGALAVAAWLVFPFEETESSALGQSSTASRERTRTFGLQPPAEEAGTLRQGSEPGLLRGTVEDEQGQRVPDIDVLIFSAAQSPGPDYQCHGQSEPEPLFTASCPEAAEALFKALEAGPLDPVPVAATRTNAKGEFSIQVAGGSYDLSAQRGSAWAVQTDVSPGGDEEIVLSLTPASDLIGKVVLANGGDPVPGADVIVAVLRPMRVLRGKADAQGAFTFKAVPTDQVGVAARAPNLVAVATTSDTSSPVVVALSAPGQVSGRVVARGEPVAGARVEVGEQSLVADAKGHFEFARVLCNPCEITAEAEGRFASVEVPLDEEGAAYVEISLRAVGDLEVRVLDRDTGEPLESDVSCSEGDGPTPNGTGVSLFKHVTRGYVDVTVAANGFVARTLNVKIGLGLNKQEVALEPELPLEGRVVDGSGQPVAEAVVQDGVVSADPTDEEGRFTLRGLGEGEHRLTATHVDYLAAEASVRLPSKAPVVITLKSGGRLVVEVLDPSGKPVSQGAAELREVNASRPQLELANEDGVATFGPLTAGQYEVTAAAASFASSLPVKVSIGEGETRIQVSVHEGASLSGQVVDEQGAPVPLAEVVAALDRTSRSRLARQVVGADEEGHFSFDNLEPGREYQLEARKDEFEGKPVRVRPGAEPVILKVGRLAAVTGRLVEGGAPVSNYSVIAGSGRGQTVDDPEGNFRAEVPAGTAELRFLGSFVERTVPLQLVPGTEVDLGDISVEGGATLQGEVTADGEPAVVSLSLIDETTRAEERTGTDEGRFEFDNLTPGHYLLRGGGPSGVVGPLSVTIGAAAPAPLHLKAQGGSRLLGVLHYLSGERVGGARVEIRSIRSASHQTVTTDSLGEFTLEHLEPGVYEVTARVENAPPAQASVTMPGVGEAVVDLQVPMSLSLASPFEDE